VQPLPALPGSHFPSAPALAEHAREAGAPSRSPMRKPPRQRPRRTPPSVSEHCPKQTNLSIFVSYMVRFVLRRRAGGAAFHRQRSSCYIPRPIDRFGGRKMSLSTTFLALAAVTAAQTEVSAAGPNGPLKGTLTRAAAASAPVVLIIPGSGPTDRDGNSPLGVRAATYRLLSEQLASRGVSTVRIDKRGMFASSAAVADANAVTIEIMSGIRAPGWILFERRRARVACGCSVIARAGWWRLRPRSATPACAGLSWSPLPAVRLVTC
jgi:hypothetical protein